MKYYILFLLFIFQIWLILQVHCGGKKPDKGKSSASKGVKSDSESGFLKKVYVVLYFIKYKNCMFICKNIQLRFVLTKLFSDNFDIA